MLPLVAMFGNNRKICAYFPGWSDGKASTNRETWVHPCVGKIPWRRKRQPTPVLLPRKSHGWRSLVQATVHGVAKSRARLSDFTSSQACGNARKRHLSSTNVLEKNSEQSRLSKSQTGEFSFTHTVCLFVLKGFQHHEILQK